MKIVFSFYRNSWVDLLRDFDNFIDGAFDTKISIKRIVVGLIAGAVILFLISVVGFILVKILNQAAG